MLGSIATTSNAKIEKKNPRINQPNALRPFDDATTAHAIARNNQSARYSTDVDQSELTAPIMSGSSIALQSSPESVRNLPRPLARR